VASISSGLSLSLLLLLLLLFTPTALGIPLLLRLLVLPLAMRSRAVCGAAWARRGLQREHMCRRGQILCEGASYDVQA
jgi:hypothetical protein